MVLRSIEIEVMRKITDIYSLWHTKWDCKHLYCSTEEEYIITKK